MAFFKDDPDLVHATLAPAVPYSALPGSGPLAKLGGSYNRIGGLIDRLAKETDIESKAVLAVWIVESGGREFIPKKPVLRFEVHKFWSVWGQQHPQTFDRHFRFGGHGTEGKVWQNHQWRRLPGEAWQRVHVDSQAVEYEVFDFAAELGGLENACLSSSFGGPQILGLNHEAIGYKTASELFAAFQDSERWHVCGFFDFVQSKNLLGAVKTKNWFKFAEGYNGASNAAEYAKLIAEAYDAAQKLDAFKTTAGLTAFMAAASPQRYRIDPAKAHSLNLRSGPKPAPVIAVLHPSHVLTKVGPHPLEPAWWEVDADMGGTVVRGFVSGAFLKPESASAPPGLGSLPEAHLRKNGAKRTQPSGRAFPLDEPSMPRRDAGSGSARAQQLWQIARYLDSPHATHSRYTPSGGSTFCNIYAYDFACLGNTYLPRVWWTAKALAAIGKGEAVPVEYAKTVRELNANALHDWFEEFGDEFGWSRLFDVDDLQSAANDGDLCILVAQRLDLNRSGHIVAILPETDVIKAERKGGRVVQPIESQAGETNHVAIVKDSPWWANEARFRSFGLWRHS
jgi:hypothetical protein